MAPVLIVVIPIAVVLLVSVVRRLRQQQGAPATGSNGSAPSASATGNAPPTFRIVALGTAGSGKTVLLSTLFHTLNFQAPGRAYHLETDHRQRLTLGRLYSAVSDTAKGWPPGTRQGETREFVFDCVGVDRQARRQTVLRLSYLDYAGELLESDSGMDGKALDDLAERINGAHGLLAMLDGHRVLQLVNGERAGHHYFERTLQPMLGFMHGASCPIHLIITKWDLVRAGSGLAEGADDRALFDRVVEALMAFDHIKALVYVHSRRQVVRLIPVSAVGTSFATLRGDGTVAKRSDGRLRPTNVDVPLCAVLPDLFRQVEHALGDTTRRNVSAEVLRAIRRDASGIVAAVLAGPAGIAVRTALQGLLGVEAGAASSTLFVEWLTVRQDGLRQARAATQARQDDLEVLREDVMDDFKRAVMRLEAALPTSELSRQW